MLPSDRARFLSQTSTRQSYAKLSNGVNIIVMILLRLPTTRMIIERRLPILKNGIKSLCKLIKRCSLKSSWYVYSLSLSLFLFFLFFLPRFARFLSCMPTASSLRSSSWFHTLSLSSFFSPRFARCLSCLPTSSSLRSSPLTYDCSRPPITLISNHF